jgi:hypothetical protein
MPKCSPALCRASFSQVTPHLHFHTPTRTFKSFSILYSGKGGAGSLSNILSQEVLPRIPSDVYEEGIIKMNHVTSLEFFISRPTFFLMNHSSACDIATKETCHPQFLVTTACARIPPTIFSTTSYSFHANHPHNSSFLFPIPHHTLIPTLDPKHPSLTNPKSILSQANLHPSRNHRADLQLKTAPITSTLPFRGRGNNPTFGTSEIMDLELGI